MLKTYLTTSVDPTKAKDFKHFKEFKYKKQHANVPYTILFFIYFSRSLLSRFYKTFMHKTKINLIIEMHNMY